VGVRTAVPPKIPSCLVADADLEIYGNPGPAVCPNLLCLPSELV
jgi:hypothetical protein